MLFLPFFHSTFGSDMDHFQRHMQGELGMGRGANDENSVTHESIGFLWMPLITLLFSPSSWVGCICELDTDTDLLTFSIYVLLLLGIRISQDTDFSQLLSDRYQCFLNFFIWRRDLFYGLKKKLIYLRRVYSMKLWFKIDTSL